jgi:hypothetical protein
MHGINELTGKNLFEIFSSSVSKLLLSSGITVVRILKMGDGIPSSSFDD